VAGRVTPRRAVLALCATVVVAAGAVAACAPSAASHSPDPVPRQPGPTAAHGADPGSAESIPVGFGTLRQEDIAAQVRLPQLLVRAIPLDESVIRLLSPDSYRALRALYDGQRDAIARSAARLGVHSPSVWYVSYFGLQPDARFTAREVDIASGGRDFRPLDVLPLTAGFGEERVGQGQVQSALYVFDAGIDPYQPLTVTVESTPSTSWGRVLPAIERERALVRSRAGRP
jgi:hypothetical protein